MKLLIIPTRTVLSILCVTIPFIFSCNKETSGDSLSPQQQLDASFSAAESNADAESIFNDVFDNVMGVNSEVGIEGTGVFGRMAVRGYSGEEKADSMYLVSCFTVSIIHLSASSVYPIQVTLDFGTGCQGKDGHIRSGKIITTYSGRLLTPGTTALTTFDGFYIDSINVTGTHTITNTGNLTIPQYMVDVEGATLSSPDGSYTQWKSHKIITQVAGLATPNFPLDDVFSIEGGAQGAMKFDSWLISWQSTITEPLTKEFLCHWITKGKIRAVRSSAGNNSQWVAELDFGNGVCDDLATVTVNGVSHEISLR